MKKDYINKLDIFASDVNCVYNPLQRVAWLLCNDYFYFATHKREDVACRLEIHKKTLSCVLKKLCDSEYIYFMDGHININDLNLIESLYM